MGIEPTYAAWEAAVLPLNYARKCMLGVGPFLSHCAEMHNSKLLADG